MHANPSKSSLALLVYRPKRSLDDATCTSRKALVPACLPFLLLLAVNCYLPILLIRFGVIPFAYRFYVLIAVLCIFILYGLFRGYRLNELGLTLKGCRHSLLANSIFCVGGALSLYLAFKEGMLMPRPHSHSLTSFLCYIAFLAPLQELIFRGILFAEMQRCRIVDPRLILLISTVSFSFLHIIYDSPPLLLMTFISGLVWGISYLRWPSLAGISMSHALLGAFAMHLGVL